MTDLAGLPREFRYSMWLLRQADRFGCLPSRIEDEGSDLVGHLEREEIVKQALRRHATTGGAG